MSLQALLEKSSDTDLLREMIGFAAQRLMELEVEGRTGAGHGERGTDRITRRNGYRERDWPYIWLDATCVKARRDGRIVSVAVIAGSRPRIAVGVNSEGRREVLGLAVGASEAETFWIDFPRKLARRGLRGVKLVVSHPHEGLKAAFARDDAEAARTQWRQVADRLRPRVKKLAELMDEAEGDVLADMSFPPAHRPKLHSTNPIERVNGEIKRRTEVVGIFPNDEAIARPVGAILLQQNDEWAVRRARWMTLETMAPLSDDPLVTLPAAAA
jgi:transposase-like protein